MNHNDIAKLCIYFQELQSEFKGNRVELSNLCKLADQLGTTCKPAVRETLERATNGLCTRFVKQKCDLTLPNEVDVSYKHFELVNRCAVK